MREGLGEGVEEGIFCLSQFLEHETFKGRASCAVPPHPSSADCGHNCMPVSYTGTGSRGNFKSAATLWILPAESRNWLLKLTVGRMMLVNGTIVSATIFSASKVIRCYVSQMNKLPLIWRAL